MKKLFAILCFSLFLFGTMAQELNKMNLSLSRRISVNNVYQSPVLLQQNQPKLIKRDIGDAQSVWVNLPYQLCGYLSQTWANVTFGELMFPDTFIRVRWQHTVATPTPHYEFAYFWNNWCSVGLTLNPVSDYLDNLPNLNKGQSYTVDSISFPYFYERYSDPSIIDTLVIQMYKPGKLAPYTFTTDHTIAGAVPKYSRPRKEGSPMNDFVQRIPLGPGDTTAGTHFTYIAIPVTNMTMDTGGPVALVWTFKSGSHYGFGDTIPWAKWDSVKGVSRPLNCFEWVLYDDATSKKLNEFNNGLLINSQERYTDLGPFVSSYIIGSGFGTPPHTYYPVAEFKISYTEQLGINDLTKDVKVKLFPNPVNATDNINVRLNLTSDKNVAVEVFDILGHKVATMANERLNTGEHLISMPASKLSSGIYVCKVSADNTSSSIKFNVK